MDDLKLLMKTFQKDCVTKYQMALKDNPEYVDSEKRQRDINNNEVIWQAVDNVHKIPSNIETDKWAKSLIKKFYQGTPIQWEIIDEINNFLSSN